MDNQSLSARFAGLSTANVADGCIRAGVDVRCAPAGIQSLTPGHTFAGRAIPVRHFGSVDVFLEAINSATPGDVLVIDNGGRIDESCVGDLMALEAKAAGLSGVVIWGLHRDSLDITRIGLPLFSMGAIPTGPLSVVPRTPDALRSALIGELLITTGDTALGDDDGVLFIPEDRAEEILSHATEIRATESRQANLIEAGTSLRMQVDFDSYLAKRRDDDSVTLRQHLREVGGAIEV